MNVWRYDIAQAGDGSDVTESFTLSPTFGLRLYWTLWGWSRGKVNRKDWDMKWNMVLAGGGLAASDEISLAIDLELTKPVEAPVQVEASA